MNLYKIELSLIIPVYNYQDRITKNLNLIIEFLLDLKINVEIIIVNDGSIDNTKEVIEEFLKSTKINVKLINLEKNEGKGAAVMSGFNNASGNYKIFTDCDLAYPLSEVKKIFDALKNGADIAIANRRVPGSICELNTELIPMVNNREKSGRFLNKIIRFFKLSSVTDTQAGLKGFSENILKQIGPITSKRFAFDIEILNKAEKMGAKIVNVPVRYQFFENISSVTLYKDGFKIIREILRIKFSHGVKH